MTCWMRTVCWSLYVVFVSCYKLTDSIQSPEWQLYSRKVDHPGLICRSKAAKSKLWPLCRNFFYWFRVPWGTVLGCLVWYDLFNIFKTSNKNGHHLCRTELHCHESNGGSSHDVTHLFLNLKPTNFGSHLETLTQEVELSLLSKSFRVPACQSVELIEQRN